MPAPSSPTHPAPVLDCRSSLQDIVFVPSSGSDVHPLQCPTVSLPPLIRRNLDYAAEHLRQSRLVAFPTETVYGLGANTLSPLAVSRVYTLKGRPSDNPLIVHVSSLDMLNRLLPTTYRHSKLYSALIDAFWPGPLTLLFPNPNPPHLPAPQTLAIRIPSHPLARALIQHADLPVSAPSANSSGRPSPTTAQHVAVDLGAKRLPPREGDKEEFVLGCILDGGACNVGIESTVVDGLGWDEVNGGVLKLLRPGGVGVEQLQEVVRRVEKHCGLVDGSTRIRVHGKHEQDFKADGASSIANVASNQSAVVVKVQSPKGSSSATLSDSSAIDRSAFPSTPGMKYKHYSPSVPVFLVLPNNTFRTPPAELAAGVDKPVLPRELMDRVASFVLEEQQLPPQPNGSAERKAKLGIMHFEDSPMVKAFESSNRAQKDDTCVLTLLSLGKDAEDAARQLFGGMLRLEGLRPQAGHCGPASNDVSFEEGGVDAILIEGCPDAGLGLAVMERVRKAVGGGGKGLSLTAEGERSIPSSFWVDVE